MTADELTCSTRAHSSDTAVKTRSGLTSAATSVATRRSARCSEASREISTSLASGSPCSARSSALALRVAVGQVDAGGDERGGHAVGAEHRPVGPRDQPPAAGLGLPVADLRARRARLPDVGRGSRRTPRAPPAGSRSRARRGPSTSSRREARRALARVVEEQDPRLASYTQTSDCVVSVRIAANDSPSTNSPISGASSMFGPTSVSGVAAIRYGLDLPSSERTSRLASGPRVLRHLRATSRAA